MASPCQSSVQRAARKNVLDPRTRRPQLKFIFCTVSYGKSTKTFNRLLTDEEQKTVQDKSKGDLPQIAGRCGRKEKPRGHEVSMNTEPSKNE